MCYDTDYTPYQWTPSSCPHQYLALPYPTVRPIPQSVLWNGWDCPMDFLLLSTPVPTCPTVRPIPLSVLWNRWDCPMGSLLLFTPVPTVQQSVLFHCPFYGIDGTVQWTPSSCPHQYLALPYPTVRPIPQSVLWNHTCITNHV